MGEDGDELVSFALASGGSDKRDAEKKLFEVSEGSGVKRRGEEDRRRGLAL